MRLIRTRKVFFHLLITVLILCWIVPAGAGLPAEFVKEKMDAIKKILDDPGLKDRKKARIEFVMNIVDTMIDWEETTKRALGIHWRKRTPQEKEEFTNLFKELLKRTYSEKFDLYTGQEIIFDSEKAEEDYAFLKSKIIDKKKGETITVDFRLLKNGDRWLIYDISIEGISVLNNYRVQFDEIIASSSYEELVKKMKDKLKKEQKS